VSIVCPNAVDRPKFERDNSRTFGGTLRSSGMKRILTLTGALAALALPAVVVANPTSTDSSNAAKECKAERGTAAATREAFALKYGTNHSRRNAFGKCVSRKSREEESQREHAADKAAKQCKAERDSLGVQAFQEKYGTNKKKHNAFGKCVSQRAKENKEAADEKDRQEAAAFRNAAKKCAVERRELGRSEFADKYGTNRHKRNAFGKCVSKLTRS
jgi:superfamily II DNA helicase RecQ